MINKFILLLPTILFTLAFPAQVLAATLSLTPPLGSTSSTVNRGCNFSVRIDLDTAGAQTDGVDSILLYDQSRFTATSIQNGTIYPDFPGNNIDDSSGKVTISGLASVSSAFSGQGTLATVNFTVREQAPTGVSQIKFDFDPNDKAKTTDSNVVERGTVTDILNSVTNGNYTVGTGTSCAGGTSASPKPQGATGVGPGATATPSAAEIPMKKELPDRGTPQLTFTLAIVGSVLTVLGILGLALL